MKRFGAGASAMVLSVPLILGQSVAGQAQEAVSTVQTVPTRPAHSLDPLASPNSQFAPDVKLKLTAPIPFLSDAEGWGVSQAAAIAPHPSKVSRAAHDLMPIDRPASVLTAQAESTPTTDKPASPATPAENTAKLAQAARNPIANLISVPFQNNFNFGAGPVDQTQSVLNVQPVIPVSLIVYAHSHWMLGALTTQIWSFAGDSDRAPVSQFLLQRFVNYNLPKWYLTTGPQITANWIAQPGEQWTLPLGGGINRLFRVGKQPINASL